jgi:hypothetical protein
MGGPIIIDRSNLNDIVCIVPAKDGLPARSLTRLQDLQEPGYHRCDVMLYNGRTEQAALYVTKNGFCGDMWLLEVITDAEYAELQGIAQRMRQNAIAFSPAAKLIVGGI